MSISTCKNHREDLVLRGKPHLILYRSSTQAPHSSCYIKAQKGRPWPQTTSMASATSPNGSGRASRSESSRRAIGQAGQANRYRIHRISRIPWEVSTDSYSGSSTSRNASTIEYRTVERAWGNPNAATGSRGNQGEPKGLSPMEHWVSESEVRPWNGVGGYSVEKARRG